MVQKDIMMQIEAPPILFNDTPRLIAIPHDPSITELDFTAKIDLDPSKIYEIKFDKTIVKRLPSPFPSNCTTGRKRGKIILNVVFFLFFFWGGQILIGITEKNPHATCARNIKDLCMNKNISNQFVFCLEEYDQNLNIKFGDRMDKELLRLFA